jgi:GNAT superfamily N-acetyltransferase
MSDDPRWCPRRRVYLGEGLTFEIVAADAMLDAEAIDLTPDGVGLAVLDPVAGRTTPAVGDVLSVRYTGPGASGAGQEATVRHVGSLRTRGEKLPRLGLSLVPRALRDAGVERRDGVRHSCPDGLPAFATASCPWFFQERLRFQIVELGAGGMTLRTASPSQPLLPRAELRFDLHLPVIGVEHGRGRLTSVRRDGGDLEVGVAWVDPPRSLLQAISHYLLVGDATLTPATLRDGGLAVGSVDRAVTYDCATTTADLEEILALRLLANQAEGHMASQTIDDLRSSFDGHARHITCRFGGRIVGYVRAIFVDGDPARSQYVSWGGHEAPQWLWDAGFVEGGSGAMHPDFQRTGLYVALLQHLFRVAVQSGHRYLLGACPEGLLEVYREMGFEILEERIVEPKPGWRFRSYLLYADAVRLLGDAPASKSAAAIASAIAFAGVPVAA